MIFLVLRLRTRLPPALVMFRERGRAMRRGARFCRTLTMLPSERCARRGRSLSTTTVHAVARLNIGPQLRDLTPERHDRAVEIASLPGVVRGYEQIKPGNVAAYRSRLAELPAAPPPEEGSQGDGRLRRTTVSVTPEVPLLSSEQRLLHDP